MFKNLYVYTGPGYSGKSTHLMSEYAKCNLPKIYIKFTLTLLDEPKETEIETHAGLKTIGYLANTLDQILHLCKNADVLFLDEFFFVSDPDKFNFMVRDKIIHVAGIDMDGNGKPFDSMSTLMAMADEVTKFHGTCARGNPTVYSFPLEQYHGRFNEDDGLGHKWMGVCRQCGYSRTIPGECKQAHLNFKP